MYLCVYFNSGLRAVRITTKFWEWKSQLQMRTLKRPTGSSPWNFTQIKIMLLELQKHLKVNICFYLFAVTFFTFFLACSNNPFFVSLSAIGNAYAVLSNAEKRRQYDQYGEERTQPSRHRHHHDFEADISPEDLFNMFFGGGFPSSERRKKNDIKPFKWCSPASKCSLYLGCGLLQLNISQNILNVFDYISSLKKTLDQTGTRNLYTQKRNLESALSPCVTAVLYSRTLPWH